MRRVNWLKFVLLAHVAERGMEQIRTRGCSNLEPSYVSVVGVRSAEHSCQTFWWQ